MILGHQRRIQGRCHYLARVSAFYVDFTLDDGDARYAARRIVRILLSSCARNPHAQHSTASVIPKIACNLERFAILMLRKQ